MQRVTRTVLAVLFLAISVAAHGSEGESPAPEGVAAGDASTAAAAGARDEYRIGPEDQLRISVWDNRELTQDVVVRPDGKISLPLLQDVDAEGLTASELAVELSRRLSAFVKEPQVSVILLQVNAPKVYILGNVARPGTYPLRGSMSVLQALSIAGGLTPFAKAGAIRIVRVAPDGKQRVRTVSFNRIIEDEGKGNYPLKAGDTIVVP